MEKLGQLVGRQIGDGLQYERRRYRRIARMVKVREDHSAVPFTTYNRSFSLHAPCHVDLTDRCSHANYKLSEGDVDCDEKTLTCWKHGAEFSLIDGEPQTLPATQPVPVWDLEVAAGEVFVNLPGEAS